MYGKGRKKGTVRFAVQADGGKKVAVVGTFSDWLPVQMRKQKDGSFVANIAVPPGNHEYKFIIDGEWVVDPDHGAWALNPYGTLNSLAIVEG